LITKSAANVSNGWIDKARAVLPLFVDRIDPKTPAAAIGKVAVAFA